MDYEMSYDGTSTDTVPCCHKRLIYEDMVSKFIQVVYQKYHYLAGESQQVMLHLAVIFNQGKYLYHVLQCLLVIA